jgi:cytochrome c-type biogenesis protein CcmH/NrfF
MLDLAELVFVALFLAGVALWWPPAALMLGGVMGVVACERRSAARRPQVARGEAASSPRLRSVA